MRVLKYLRGHIPAVALIVLLLVAQSFCELSLPAYTSRIVDTGIQSGGIEYAAPLALTDKTMDGVRLFLSDDDAAAVSAAYTDADGVWTINDTAQLPELEGIFVRPLVMYARLSEQGANTVLALRQQMQGGLITHEEILARGEEALSGMGTLTDSVLHSAAVQFLKTEYAVAGLNVNHIRNSYLLRTGGRPCSATMSARGCLPPSGATCARRCSARCCRSRPPRWTSSQRPRSSRAPRTTSRRSRRCAC